MKIRFINIPNGYKFVDGSKELRIGDKIVVDDTRGEELISRGIVEEVKPIKKITERGE